MNCNLVLMVGPPGSGKTTEAHRILAQNPGHSVIASADHFFMKGSKYEFDRTKLGLAHFICQYRTFSAMEARVPLVIVDNCSITADHRKLYVQMAVYLGYRPSYRIAGEDPSTWNALAFASRNVHEVPLEAIERMISQFQPIDTEGLEPWSDDFLKG